MSNSSISAPSLGPSASLSKMRLIQMAMVATIVAFPVVGEMIRPAGSEVWTTRHWVFAGAAVWAIGFGFFMRNRALKLAETSFVQDPSGPKGLKQWELAQIFGFAMAESVFLWGFALRMAMGAALWQASIFYATSLLLQILWAPRLPEAVLMHEKSIKGGLVT